MKKSRVIGLIILALLIVAAGVWVAIPAMARGPAHQEAVLEAWGSEAIAPGFEGAFDTWGNDAPRPGFSGHGPMMRPMANLTISGNVKTVTTDAAGKIQTIVISHLQGNDVTFQANENTQYRFALGLTGVAVNSFVTIIGRRVPGANPHAGMVIVNSATPVFFVNGKVTAKGADTFTVKLRNKEYIVKVDGNTKYRVVTPPPPPAPRQGPMDKVPGKPRPQGPQGKPQQQGAKGAGFEAGMPFQIQLVADPTPTPTPRPKPAPRPGPTVTNGTFGDVQVGSMVTVRATGSADNLLATNVTVFVPRPQPVPTPTPTPGAAPNAKGASFRFTD